MDVDKPVVSFTSLLGDGSHPVEGSVVRGRLVGLKYVEDNKLTQMRLDSLDKDDELRHATVELRRMKPAFDAWNVKAIGSDFELDLAGCELLGELKRLVFKDTIAGRYSHNGGWERFAYTAEKKKNGKSKAPVQDAPEPSRKRKAEGQGDPLATRPRTESETPAAGTSRSPSAHAAPDVRRKPLRKEGSRYALQPGEDEDELKSELVVDQLPGTMTRSYIPLTAVDASKNGKAVAVFAFAINIQPFKQQNNGGRSRTFVALDPSMPYADRDGVACTLMGRTDGDFPPIQADLLVLRNLKPSWFANKWKLSGFTGFQWAAWVDGNGWSYSTNWGEHLLMPDETSRALNLLAWRDIQDGRAGSRDLSRIGDSAKVAPPPTSATTPSAQTSCAAAALPLHLGSSRYKRSAAHNIFAKREDGFGGNRSWTYISELDAGHGSFANLIVEVIDYWDDADTLGKSVLTVTDYTENQHLFDIADVAPGQGGRRGPLGKRTLRVYVMPETRKELVPMLDRSAAGGSSLRGKLLALNNVRTRFLDATFVGSMHDSPANRGSTHKGDLRRVEQLNSKSKAVAELLAAKAKYEKEHKVAEEKHQSESLSSLFECKHAGTRDRVFIRTIKKLSKRPSARLCSIGMDTLVRARIVDFHPPKLDDWITAQCESCAKKVSWKEKRCCGKRDFFFGIEGQVLLEDDISKDDEAQLEMAAEGIEHPDTLEIVLDREYGYRFFGFEDRDDLAKELNASEQLRLPARFEAVMGKTLCKFKAGFGERTEIKHTPPFVAAVRSQHKRVPVTRFSGEDESDDDPDEKEQACDVVVHTIFDTRVTADGMAAR